jgi:hypothetical protein
MQADFSLVVIYRQPQFLRSLQARDMAGNLVITRRLLGNALRPAQP